MFWDGDSDEASLQPSMAATLLMLKYAPMASSTTKANQYTVSAAQMGIKGSQKAADNMQNFARSQLDYLLGNNPMNGKRSSCSLIWSY